MYEVHTVYSISTVLIQWVIDLDYESERLTGATEHSIIIIDTNVSDYRILE